MTHEPPPTSETRAKRQVREFLRVISARRRVVVASVVAVVATVFVLNLLATPEYTATATVLIEQTGPDVLTFKDVIATDRTYQGNWKFYQTQYKLFRSRAVLQIAATNLGLLDDPQYVRRRPSAIARLRGWVSGLLSPGDAGPDDPMAGAIGFLGSRLSVEPVRDSQIVEVSFTHGDPEFARRAAAAAVDAYAEFTLQGRSDTKRLANNFLTKEVATVQAEIAALEKSLQEYGATKEIVSLGSGDSNISEQALADLSAQHVAARSRLAVAEARFLSVRDADPAGLPEVLNSPLIARLKEHHAEVERRYSQMAERFKDDWPPLRQLRDELDQSRSRLVEETESIARQARALSENDYARARSEEQKLGNQVERQKTEVQRTRKDAIQYAGLQSEIATKRSILSGLLARQTETATSERMETESGTSNIRVVDYPALPKSPTRPRKLTNLTLALVVGVVAGVGLAFLLEHLDNTVKSGDEVARLTGLPILSRIPRHEPLRAARPGGAGEPAESAPLGLVSHQDPRCAFAEAFKSLRTSLLLSAAEPPRRLMITSCQPKDGKSTVSMNLAIVLAQLGRRVLLVDADLRIPRLHKTFGVSNRVGLSSYLSGLSSIEEILVETEVPGLAFVPSGPIPPNPSELLGSSRLASLVERASGLPFAFDYLLFDSSPLLSVSDPFLLASHVDASILVIRAGETTRESVVHGLDRFRQARARLLGLVFNGVDESDIASYYGRYRNDYVGSAAHDAAVASEAGGDAAVPSRRKRWGGRA